MVIFGRRRRPYLPICYGELEFHGYDYNPDGQTDTTRTDRERKLERERVQLRGQLGGLSCTRESELALKTQPVG